MFDNPKLNAQLKQAQKKYWRRKNQGVLSTKGSRKFGRKSRAYLVWRRYVLKRDGFACVKCGSKKRIQAHHKKSWFEFKGQKDRFNVNNGITLCFICHKKIHPWL